MSGTPSLPEPLNLEGDKLCIGGYYAIVVDANGRLPSGKALLVMGDSGHLREICAEDLEPRRPPPPPAPEPAPVLPPKPEPPVLLRPEAPWHEPKDVPGGSTCEEDDPSQTPTQPNPMKPQ